MKFIAWGQKLHQGTHSYVHDAFCTAFKNLGYDTYHLDDNDNISSMSFKDTIFITLGGCDKNIPITNDAKYILHNCDAEKYKDIKEENKITLQVYTNAIAEGTENYAAEEIQKIDELVYWSEKGRKLYQPWATNLLPEEINNKYEPVNNKTAIWCGSVWGGIHGNIEELTKFNFSLQSKGYQFQIYRPGSTSFEQNKQFVKNNELAPAINGTWQKNVHYIPCRIFKNISYGALGITNNEAVYNLLQGQVIYSQNEEELIDLYLSTPTQKRKEMFENSCELVKTKHTYINRAKAILECLS
jgi:hypothetical protein